LQGSQLVAVQEPHFPTVKFRPIL